MKRPLRLGIRTRLLLAAVGAVALALVVGVTAFNLFLGQRLSASATSLARAQAAAELSSLEVVDGKLVSPTGLEEGSAVGSPVWVFAGTTVLEKPRVPEALTAVAVIPRRGARAHGSVQRVGSPVRAAGDPRRQAHRHRRRRSPARAIRARQRRSRSSVRSSWRSRSSPPSQC